MNQAAVFLDRDNTIIEDPGYLADASEVRLIPGAAEAIRKCKAAGYKVVVVTNQSGIARGLISEAQLLEIHDQLEALLHHENTAVDGIYFCPFLDGPEAIVARYRQDSILRKPKPGMLLQAADELGLDLNRSWMIGDSPSDVQAGLTAGCRTVFLSADAEPPDDLEADFVVAGLCEAVDVIVNGSGDPVTAASPRAELPAAEPQDDQPQVEPECEPGGAPEAESEPDDEPDAAPEPEAEARPDLLLPDRSELAPPDPTLDVLKEIRSLLLQQRRVRLQRDFSLARLGATLFQFVALAVLLWGLAAFVGGGDGAAQAVLLRFALAAVVQLMALTLFVIDRSE